jgi:hypothetical protein
MLYKTIRKVKVNSMNKVKPSVEFEGATYKVKSIKTEIPDLYKMDHFSALFWLLQNTYPVGRCMKKPNPLAGMGDIYSV